jgi:hypothetical protein
MVKKSCGNARILQRFIKQPSHLVDIAFRGSVVCLTGYWLRVEAKRRSDSYADASTRRRKRIDGRSRQHRF